MIAEALYLVSLDRNNIREVKSACNRKRSYFLELRSTVTNRRRDRRRICCVSRQDCIDEDDQK
jgi:hypothetical protein